MGRNILIFSAILAISPAALAQDIYGPSGGSLYDSPSDNPAVKSPEQQKREAEEAQAEAAKQAVRKQKRITRYEKQQKAFLASSLTVGIVGGAGGIATGAAFLAIAKKQEKRRSNPQMLDSMLYLQDLESNAVKNKKISYIAFGVGGAATVTAIVLGVLEVQAKHKLEKAKVALVPSFSPQESSLTLAMSF